MRRWPTSPAAAMACLCVAGFLAASLSGCGLPRDESARSIDRNEVPYNLLGKVEDSPGRSTPEDASTSQPTLYWVEHEKNLVAVAPSVPVKGTRYAQVQQLLRELSGGPPVGERTSGLSTNLSPGTNIEVTELSGSTVVLDVGTGSQPPSADRLPLAIGQVVLTATSIAAVDQVVFTRDGEPLQAPLPGGALTSQSVTAADYSALVHKHKP